MQMKSKIFFLLSFFILLGLASCEPEGVDPGGTDDNPIVVARDYGTLEVEFRVPGSFLPPSRVLRADLSLAFTAEELYQGNFCYVANVYNSTLVYKINLDPGQYYYQAGIVCIAKGDSCSAAGFPGGQFGMKWAIGRVNILKDESFHVVPQFTQ